MWYRLAQNISGYLQNSMPDIEKAIFKKLFSIRSAIASAAQQVYDEWDPKDVDTYANGGICNLIAPEIARVVQSAFPEYTVLTANYESPNHEYVQLILTTDENFYDESNVGHVSVFDIDIPYNLYEIHNSEYDWSKIENVVFNEDSVFIEYRTDNLENLRYY